MKMKGRTQAMQEAQRGSAVSSQVFRIIQQVNEQVRASKKLPVRVKAQQLVTQLLLCFTTPPKGCSLSGDHWPAKLSIAVHWWRPFCYTIGETF